MGGRERGVSWDPYVRLLAVGWWLRVGVTAVFLGFCVGPGQLG